MIKVKIGEQGGAPLYLFGLARGNIERLQQGKHILVDLRSIGGPDARMAIVYGETEHDIVKELRSAGLEVPDLPDVAPGEEVVVMKPQPDVPGPTGDFPRGKMRADDQGGLVARMELRDGALIIHFGKPVAWVGLDIANVEWFIARLQEKLAEMKKVGA
jgi:hypothetical protein